MKVHLYIASSLEGYIADDRGDTDWVLDDELYEKTSRAYGCICMGRTTHDEYGGPAFKGVQQIVLTRKLPKKPAQTGVYFVDSVEAALVCAQKLGFKKLLVIGGAKTNQSFMQAGAVSKIFTDIHPIMLGKGLSMLGDFKAKFDFKMIRQQTQAPGFIHAEYRVGKIYKSVAVIIVRDEEGNYFIHHRGPEAKICPDTWGIGTTGAFGDTEEPDAAAAHILREKTRLKKPIIHRLTTEYPKAEPTTALYVYELTVSKQKDYKNAPEWDKVTWVNGEKLNRLAADGELNPEAAWAYEKYKETL